MISLFLDSSSYQVIVGIYKDTNNLYMKTEENDNHLSERLLPMIVAAFDSISMSIQQIDRIYVVNGPGSFTGVRIGVTIAKILAWSLQKEVFALSELELLATTESHQDFVVSMIDARRKAVYAGIYDQEGNVLLKDQYILLEELKTKIPNSALLVSFDVEGEEIVKPKVVISKIIERHMKDMPIHPHELKPNYLKLTEAEAKLNENKEEQ